MEEPEDFARIGAALPDPFRLLIREEVGSTNDEIRVLAEAGGPEGLILLALHQTQGRGRRGATWFSAAGESLAFSLLMRPREPKALWPRLALAAGLAVAEALERFVPLTGIKWPNDVWISGRKIAGILVETGHDFAVVGIGINLHTTSFPAAVSATATSLALESGRQVPRPEVLAAVIQRFAQRHTQIGAAFPELIEAIRLRCVLTGHDVALRTSAGPLQGRVEEISSRGELVLHTREGIERLHQADEVRLI